MRLKARRPGPGPPGEGSHPADRRAPGAGRPAGRSAAARYRGLPKIRPGHAYMACALNLLRLQAYWAGTPPGRRRTSHLPRLELGLAA